MATDDLEQPSFFRQHRIGLVMTAIALVGLGFVVHEFVQNSGHISRRPPELVMIKLPPPPPPTPQQQPTPEQKVDEQHEEKIETPEEKPKDEPPRPPDEPPIGTGIKGNGSGDGFGLTGSNGNGFGNGGGSRFDWYAGQVQRTIADALRSNSATREATLSIKVRVWADNSGVITNAELLGSTGDTALDNTLRNQVLTGVRVSERPPDGMPMPILLRLTARRPR